jgi:hypothetical protein
MIRRDWNDAQAPPRWILISQVEHARISGQLAEAWGGPAVPALPVREQLVAAVYHHDDGWHEWERAPSVNSATGRPRSFTEMPLADALAIWRRSIERCESHSPLAAWLAAGHFAALLSGGSAWQQTPPNPCQAAQEFLDQMHALRAGWLAQWQAADPARHTRETAQQALEYLQLFDALSLWLCCAAATAPLAVATPGERIVRLTPLAPDSNRPTTDSAARCGAAARGDTAQVFVIAADPWPFSLEGVVLDAPGDAIPAEVYGNDAQLAAARREAVSLQWRIFPG